MEDNHIIFTENGAAFFDKRTGDTCDDPRRIGFLEKYIKALHQAMQDGVNVKGYFVWSLMDNFEWADGYKMRFGLTFIDYEDNQKRIPKSSYYWYKDAVKENGILKKEQNAA